MAKAGMRRPNPYDADNHGTENHHKMNRPENKQAQVPEIQGAAKNGNAKAGPIHAPNWARDDYRIAAGRRGNEIPPACLTQTNLTPTPPYPRCKSFYI